MRIATWNISEGKVRHEGGAQKNIGYYGQQLSKINPDVVCLQEAAHISEANNQAKTLASHLGMAYCIMPLDKSLDQQWNALAILSKIPLYGVEKLFFSNPGLISVSEQGTTLRMHNKGILSAKLKYWEHEIPILCGHLFSFHVFGRTILEPEFEAAREEISQAIVQRTNPRSIICADMNIGTLSKAFPAIYQAGLRELIESPTIQKGLWLDHILAGKNIHCEKAAVIRSNTSHYLCYADIEPR